LPIFVQNLVFGGAGNRTRTRDPLITNQVLYQLSYAGTGARVTGNPAGAQAAALPFKQ
jgi:hypothetical protein